MAAPSNISLTLTLEFEKFVRERIASGKYRSEGEILLGGLMLLEQQVREADADFLALKAKLQRASEQADRGQFATIENVMERIAESKRRR